jgi:hypothetical protein
MRMYRKTKRRREGVRREKKGYIKKGDEGRGGRRENGGGGGGGEGVARVKMEKLDRETDKVRKIISSALQCAK